MCTPLAASGGNGMGMNMNEKRLFLQRPFQKRRRHLLKGIR